MGIREYFKQHPEEENLKLQNMVIKEKEPKEAVFDVENELTEQDWEDARKLLEKYKIENEWLKFIHLANIFKVIDPSFLNQFDLEQLWPAIKEKIDEHIHIEEKKLPLGHILSILRDLKCLFPNKVDIQNELADTDYEDYEKRLLDHIKTGTIEMALNSAVLLKAFCPKYSSFDILLMPESDIIFHQEVAIKMTLLWRLANLKILFPEFIQKNKDKINPEEIWKEAMKWLKKNNLPTDLIVSDRFVIAAAIKILCADKAEITPEGIKLTQSAPKLKSEKSKRPERKKF